jgi:hypothetical protein
MKQLLWYVGAAARRRNPITSASCPQHTELTIPSIEKPLPDGVSTRE